MSAGEVSGFLRRDNPLFAFTPAAWATGPVRCGGEISENEVASAVSGAAYFAGLGQTDLHDRMMALSRIHVASVLVALYADRVCPGSRPAGAGDLLAAAAHRAKDARISVPRSYLWGAGVHQAVIRALEAGDEEVTILVLVDIMLLVLEVIS